MLTCSKVYFLLLEGWPSKSIFPSNEASNGQDGCWYGYSDRCSRSFEEATTMVAGERVARACGPGVLVQEPTDYVKARGMGVAKWDARIETEVMVMIDDWWLMDYEGLWWTFRWVVDGDLSPGFGRQSNVTAIFPSFFHIPGMPRSSASSASWLSSSSAVASSPWPAACWQVPPISKRSDRWCRRAMGPQRRARRGDGIADVRCAREEKRCKLDGGLLGLERKVTSPNHFKVKSFVGGVVRHDSQY